MDGAPKSRTTVPMNRHTSGLHEGHKALLDLAHTIGDRVVAPITYMHSARWYSYLITGIKPPLNEVNIDKQLDDLKVQNTFHTLMPFTEVKEEDRLRWKEKAEGVLKLFEQYILTPFQYNSSLGLAMDLCRQIDASKGRIKGTVKYTVRGPEFHQFLTKAIKPLLGSSVEVVIYPKIHKHPQSGIKLQSGLSRIDPYFYDDIYRLRAVVSGIADRVKLGNNIDLVEELNMSYAGRLWKVYNIVALEGGIIPGRLVTYQFSFPAKSGGSIILEEIDYEL